MVSGFKATAASNVKQQYWLALVSLASRLPLIAQVFGGV